jgi:D-3-phosphoglycerate dehydrogenase
MAPNAKRVFYVKYVSSPLFMQILAQRPDVLLDRLENESPDDIATPVLNQAHVYQIGASRQVIAPHFQVADALLERTPNLVAGSSNGAGYDTVDVDACTRQGIAVVNQSGGNKEGVAEHALAMMLTLSKRIIETDRRMRAGPDIPRNQYIGRELLNRTVGVIGIGNVGGRVAELCRGLFKMRVLAYDPYLTAAQVAARGAEKVEHLDDLLRAADFVSVHCPLTRESRGMMGAAQFALMRPDAWFVTTARGFIHDEQALAEALAGGKIAGAGLDVWEDEPPPHDHPLLKFDNVLVSPHTAGATEESRENMARFAAEQVLEILDGKRPPRLVNPEVWPAYRERFERIMGFSPLE